MRWCHHFLWGAFKVLFLASQIWYMLSLRPWIANSRESLRIKLSKETIQSWKLSQWSMITLGKSDASKCRLSTSKCNFKQRELMVSKGNSYLRYQWIRTTRYFSIILKMMQVAWIIKQMSCSPIEHRSMILSMKKKRRESLSIKAIIKV